MNVPSAGHASRESDQIPLTYFNRFAAIWGNSDLACDKIASFRLIITPGELGSFLTPNRPIKNAEFV